jgi:ATP-dependent phosphofructokinase / diphosphate-dependent phosphofructokinase
VVKRKEKLNMAAGNLLIAQGGGPTSVINCSLVGVIEEAARLNVEGKVIGALQSIEGIINENFIDLGQESAANLKEIYNTPGAALGSCRRKMNEGDYARIVEIFRRYDIRYFLYNGGNGSMHTAYRVDEIAKSIGYELNVIGIPKTIDNDLAYTDHCPGFGSAARYIASLTHEIGWDVKSLPPPITIIEAPGRNAGWLAAASSLGKEKDDDAPNLIYLPEREFKLWSFLSDVETVYKRIGRVVIVVCEGLKDETGLYLGGVKAEASKDGFGRGLPGGAASFLAEKISENLKLRARSEKPGLAARAAIEYVSKVDQSEAYMAGIMAVRSAVHGKSGAMMTLEREEGNNYLCDIGEASLKDVAINEKLMPSDYINNEGNYITEAFLQYCRPLIGDKIKSFASLEGFKLKENFAHKSIA